VLAALFHRRGMGSVHEWRVVLVSGIWIHLGIGLSLGMDAVPLWLLGISAGVRMGVAAGDVVGCVENGSACPEFAAALYASTTSGFTGAHGCRESRTGAGDDRAVVQPHDDSK